MAAPEIKVVDEIPEAMKRLASLIARSFWGPEHSIVVDYIKRNTSIREDTLRDITKFEPKYLRQILIQLKSDKLIKERQLKEQKDESARAQSVNYYFLNYRAIANVTKYKLDHMRQKLETREKDNTNQATFKCDGCEQSYDVMEMDRLFDPVSGEMTCWRCNQIVVEDAKAGPSASTRSSLASFNDQLTGVFSILQQLDGVQLAGHLLEPPAPITEVNADGDGSQSNSGHNSQRNGLPALGARAYGAQFNLYRQEVTLNIEDPDKKSSAPSQGKGEQGKQQPAWLSTSAVPGLNLSNIAHETSTPNNTDLVSTTVNQPESSVDTEPDAKRPRPVDISLNLGLNQPDNGHKTQSMLSPSNRSSGGTTPAGIKLVQDDLIGSPTYPSSQGHNQENTAAGTQRQHSQEDEDEDEDEFEDVGAVQVTVAGVAHDLSTVMSTPSLVHDMTDVERDAYVQAAQKAMEGVGF